MAENFAEVGIRSVLIEHGQSHRAMRGKGVDGLIAEGRIGEVVERYVGGVGTSSAPRACSPFVPCSTDRAGAVRTTADGNDQAGRGGMSQMTGDRLGPVGFQQLVEIIRVHPQRDQPLIGRQRAGQRVQDRAI